ncbi:MAG: CDP-glycerol glycerophosphotransferase family protein [Eubacterium sp.]|nr:CDP-glycerol glycerophosphotransferase family protein [Eubacterium sp.]
MILDFYLKNVIERGFFKSLCIVLDKLLKKLHIYLFRHLYKVQKNKIVFLTFSGAYECNPKWIADEMIKEKAPYTYIWGIKEDTPVGAGYFPPQIKTINRESFAFYKHLFTAGVIIDNGIAASYLGYPVKRNQILIETWHGSLGIKRFDADTNKNKRWVKKAKKEAKMTDYIISNSSFEDDVYRNSFWKKTPIWRDGHARNDILLNKEKADISALEKIFREKYNIPEKNRLCLYAPTFRDDGDLSPYTLDYEALAQAFAEKFGGEWTILVRFHARIRSALKDYSFPAKVINVSDYVDIQEIMCFIDAGITDYSSWICEYVLTRKPGFIFATDASTYEKSDRAFFFPLTYMPFPVAEDEKTLERNIADFDLEAYKKDCDRFLGEMGSVDDGNAAKRITERIQKLVL